MTYHGVGGFVIVVDIQSLGHLKLLVRRSYRLLGRQVDFPPLASRRSQYASYSAKVQNSELSTNLLHPLYNEFSI